VVWGARPPRAAVSEHALTPLEDLLGRPPWKMRRQ
jgi:hypothetical protein